MTPEENKKRIHDRLFAPKQTVRDPYGKMSVSEFNSDEEVNRLANSVFGYLSTENKS